MEIALVVGTRPEIIKTAPVLRAIEEVSEASSFLIHTEQHYDDTLSSSFFDALDLSEPDARLDVGSGSHHEQTATGLSKLGRTIGERDSAVLLAQGDTNAVLSAAIAASKTPTSFGHIEAGLRSFDRSMPEEINRIVADAVADFAFAPTETAVTNLEREGRSDRTYCTGNTIVDACRRHLSIAERKSTSRADLGVDTDEYAVATIHRPFNTDREDRLAAIVEALDDAPLPVILPAHPRTASALETFEIAPSGSLRLIEPLDYLDFLDLLGGATLVVTDSGGIQEEASILEIPCLTVRPNTERPETVEAGVNRLVEPSELHEAISTLVHDEERLVSMRGHPDLYGDGHAGERIVEILRETLGNG